jgi:hypothetical protein
MAFCTGPIVAFFKSILFGGAVGATNTPKPAPDTPDSKTGDTP